MTFNQPGRNWIAWSFITIIGLLATGVAAYYLALEVLRGKVLEALGPGSQVRAIQIHWTGVQVYDLRIPGSEDWPAAEALRAERITLSPSLASLFTRPFRIHTISVENPYLCLYRTHANKLLIVPNLLTEAKPAASSQVQTTPLLVIEEIRLMNAMIEFHDATVQRPPFKLRLEQAHACIENTVFPGLDAKCLVDIHGIVKGPHQDGRAEMNGWIVPANLDSVLTLKLLDVDLSAFQPYLTAAGDTRIRKGRLDLDLQSHVNHHRLDAPGEITISDLTLGTGRGWFNTFMGVPQETIVAFYKDKGGRIKLHFHIEGDLTDPNFALNDVIAHRLALAMADFFKEGIGGITRGTIGLGGKGAQTVGRAAKGLGHSAQTLFNILKHH